ncbi:MAG: 16S rRNA (cytidine(1402)-2'-O)-methyltransferase [Rhodospirillaceae bacterium]|nr:16S rRNA (cytidine(1402)-2'-O)-methyltransferase [Rhodospirillaceae bacterium]
MAKAFRKKSNRQIARVASKDTTRKVKPGWGETNVATLASKSGTGISGETQAAEIGPKLPAGLYVVATPIGNLGDLSTRAAETLRGASVIACEDTRVTGGLLQRFGIATPMTPYHDHNAERVRPALLARLTAGESVALVSDAGTPLISDPGYKLVRACADGGIAVIPIPGPSAILAALTVAALPTDRVFFAGFLPAKTAARRTAISELKSLRATLVFYESTQRLADSLADLAAVLGPRPAAVCRELTKLHEEVRRGNLVDLADTFAREGPPKGEAVLVVDGADGTQDIAADLDETLRHALATMSVRDAAATVAEALQLPRRSVYARALELSRS